MEQKQNEPQLQTKTPQQLTNNKIEGDEDEGRYDSDEIVDETPKNLEEGINDYYGEDEEIGNHDQGEGDDGFDMDYSQTHLDDFLKS